MNENEHANVSTDRERGKEKREHSGGGKATVKKAKSLGLGAVASSVRAAKKAGRSTRSLGAELKRFLLNGDFLDLLLAVVIGCVRVCPLIGFFFEF